MARICFRLDGLPLALELAAGRLGGLGTSALAERLDDRFRLLRTDSRPAPTRQQTLLATLQWSHDLLTVPEQVLLRRLSVFAGGFELAAAEDVCADGQLPAQAIADVLARLVEKSLVSTDGADRVPRYQLLESVRLFAGERLLEAGERQQLRAAARALGAGAGRARGPSAASSTARSRTCARPTTRCSPEQRLRFCVALLPLWLRRIDLEEAHRRFLEALDGGPRHPPASGPRRCWRCPRSTTAPARSRAARRTCDEAHAIAEQPPTESLRWRTLQRFGEFAIGRDDAVSAAKHFEQARRLARREGQRGRGGGVGLLARRGPPQRRRPRRSRTS